MGFKRSYEDAYGNFYQESYWYAGTVTIDKASNTGTISIKGYKDKNARDNYRKAIGEKNYTITDNDFLVYLERLLTGDGNGNPLDLAYEAILNINDSYKVDEEGKQIPCNFFENAEIL